MEETIKALIALYWAYAPWILTSLVPSLIVGLSLSPRTKSLADKLKSILQFLSVVTPKDAPGTFKLPFKVVNGTGNQTSDAVKSESE